MVDISFFFPRASRDFYSLPSIKLLEENGDTNTRDILLKVLDRIVPTPKEELSIKEKVKSILYMIATILDEEKINHGVRVELEGSLAKGTWLSGNADVDIFLLFDPNEVPSNYKKYFLHILNLIATKSKAKYQIRFAEHPYVRIRILDLEVDIVPAFDVPSTSIISAVDRTPHHTRYVREHLTPKLANEVRLLKAFLKGIEAYGAEIKVGGFSGYACELLIIYRRSFIDVLKLISRKKRFFIDITKTWKLKDALKTFQLAEFILIDPTDRTRNVTSALRREVLYRAQLMAKLFFLSPKVEYFYSSRGKIGYQERIAIDRVLTQRSIILVILKKDEKVPPDVYWGQARRVLNGIKKLINNHEDFELLLADIIEDPKEVVLIIEVDNLETKKIKKICGPPTYAKLESIIKFIKQHGEESLAGPWVEDDRVCVLKFSQTEVIRLIDQYLSTIKIAPSFKTYHIIYKKEEILNTLNSESLIEEFTKKITRREIMHLLS